MTDVPSQPKAKRARTTTFLFWELLLALLAAALLVCWFVDHGGRKEVMALLDSRRTAIYGALTAIHASLLGFVIATTTIVMGFVQTPRFKLLRESPVYPQLWKVFTSAMRWLGASLLAALVALIVDREMQPNSPVLLLVTVTTLTASIRLARCLWAVEKMIGIMTKKPGALGPPRVTAAAR